MESLFSVRVEVGRNVELRDLAQILSDFATVAEIGLRVDRAAGRTAAERDVMTATLYPSSVLSGAIDRVARGNGDVARLLFEAYYGGNLRPDTEVGGPLGFAGHRTSLPMFDQVVSAHMKEFPGRYQASEARVRGADYRNPLTLAFVTELGDAIETLAVTGLLGGGMKMILELLKIQQGAGPEERANARLATAKARQIERDLDRAVARELPSAESVTFGSAEADAVARLAQLELEVHD